MNHRFTNDYSEIAAKEIIKAVYDNIDDQNIGYGLDVHSSNAKNLILKTFNVKDGDVFFVSGGTQANMLVISYLLKPYEGVIACNTGHINVHETASVEGSGHKIYTVPNHDGKVTANEVKKALAINRDEHMVKLKMVYISNSTETGTIYSIKELKELRQVCDENNLILFMDGARLPVALTSPKNDVKKEDLGELCDVFYAGGTKNGLMSGEAIVFKNKEVATDFRWHIKNKGAMLAKGFVLGIQFERAFSDNLYFDLAANSNTMAGYLKENLKDVVEFTNDSPTNQLFFKVDTNKATKVINDFGLELWEDLEDKQVVRIVTSFATTKEDCDSLIKYLKELCK